MIHASTYPAASLVACQMPSCTHQLGVSNARIIFDTSFYNKHSPAASFGGGVFASATWGMGGLPLVEQPIDQFIEFDPPAVLYAASAGTATL
jgi:hypothetical protein